MTNRMCKKYSDFSGHQNSGRFSKENPTSKSPEFRVFVWNCILPETNSSSLKIGHPKRKRSYSNHPFSGAKMLVLGSVVILPRISLQANGIRILRKKKRPNGIQIRCCLIFFFETPVVCRKYFTTEDTPQKTPT